MSQLPPMNSPPMMPVGGGMLKPHRAGTVLALGILALVLNFGCGLGWILGIIAWVMGNADLREMDAGTMDPSGRGNTSAGRICGIISVVLAAIGLVVYVALMALGILSFAAAGAAGAGRP